MKKAELVFIPSPFMGHLASIAEVAKLLIDQNDLLNITVLLMKLNFDTKIAGYLKSLSESSTSRIKFVDLPQEDHTSFLACPNTFIYEFIDAHKIHVRGKIAEMFNSESSDLAGVVVDMFCTSMIDVANDFGVPSYVFYTSGAAMLGLVFHMQSLRDDFDVEVTDYKYSDAEVAVSTYMNPVPAKVFPADFFDKEGGTKMFLNQAKRFRETKGIMINTFRELESYAIQALSNDENIPPIYTVGPILNLKVSHGENQGAGVILKWLDLQPHSSVVFLCFGSEGSFDDNQVKEIAKALEHSGYRFLWTLRRPPPKGEIGFPSEYENFEEVLPEGFLERTAEVGKVISWAPQVEVLSHPAVGGFVSHCGWNSTLESVWCGMPVATWPLYAEQQVNAFLMVKELEMAVEIKMDYYIDFRMRDPDTLSADLIEDRIRHMMDPTNAIRHKVKEMKEKSRLSLKEGGSSLASLRCFIDDLLNNIP